MNPDEVVQQKPLIIAAPGPPTLNVISSSNNTKKRNIIIITSTIIGVVVVVFVLNFFHIISLSDLFKPKSISRQVAPTAILAKGILTAINGSDLTVVVYNKPQNFSIAQTKDIKKVISGKLGKSDAKVGLAAASELKIGQEILIIADQDSTLAKTVYILR